MEDAADAGLQQRPLEAGRMGGPQGDERVARKWRRRSREGGQREPRLPTLRANQGDEQSHRERSRIECSGQVMGHAKTAHETPRRRPADAARPWIAGGDGARACHEQKAEARDPGHVPAVDLCQRSRHRPDRVDRRYGNGGQGGQESCALAEPWRVPGQPAREGVEETNGHAAAQGAPRIGRVGPGRAQGMRENEWRLSSSQPWRNSRFPHCYRNCAHSGSLAKIQR